jgi:arsenate reductase-like glutaredoxin family protein
MDSLLEHQFKVAIDRLKMDNFQGFTSILFLKVYGQDFDITKNCKDKGCDGIIGKQVIIAVYSPENRSLREFKKKVDKDYQKYEINWKTNYPYWQFVYNGEFTAEMLLHLNKKEGGKYSHICINKIIEMINKLEWSQKRELAINKLGIKEEYITNNLLKEIIEDLIKTNCSQIPKKTIPPNILNKIEINYTKEDINTVIKQHQEMMPRIFLFEKVLNSYKSEEIASLKMKITEEYKKFSGSFKEKFKLLAESLAGQNKQDDLYMLNMYAVLMYFFQICLIGEEVK